MRGECGVLVERALDDALQDSIDNVLEWVCHHKAVVLRAPAVQFKDFRRLMQELGAPVHHILAQYCLPQHREVLLISNLYRNGGAIGVHEGGTYWHTDLSYRRSNTVLTALHAELVPHEGGCTELLDCHIGLERLRTGLAHEDVGCIPKNFPLDTAMVIHRFGNREKRRDPDAPTQILDARQTAQLAEDVIHPLVIRHPLTGRDALYAVAGTSVQLVDHTIEESNNILNDLLDYLLQHAPRYVHSYRPGDVLLWDNLATLHRGHPLAITSNANNCRLLYRINVDYINRG